MNNIKIKKLDLYDISMKIMTTTDKLSEKLPQLQVAESQYQGKYYDFLLRSKMGSQSSREAEAHKLIEQEEIYDKYLSLKMEVKLLYTHLDAYKTISSNLRNLSYGV